MNEIRQNCECKIYYSKKTVDWLVNNTRVKTFDSVKFTGYQRKVNPDHVNKIVEYLKHSDFYLPTAIICASEDSVNEDTKLNIVDGQHRIEAFKALKEKDTSLYDKISDKELPVIILEKPSESLEVNTFITINKTSKKVDTSLAYVLKNKISRELGGSESPVLTRREYLAVELAMLLNQSDTIWQRRISLEGNPTKRSYETISLNSFVNSMKALINHLNQRKIIEIDWQNESEFKEIIEKIRDIYVFIWEQIRKKWPELLDSNPIHESVLQGTIGVTSINKYIILQLHQVVSINDISSLKKYIERWFKDLNIESKEWHKGGRLSQFSSASGFNIVAKILFDSYNGAL